MSPLEQLRAAQAAEEAALARLRTERRELLLAAHTGDAKASARLAAIRKAIDGYEAKISERREAIEEARREAIAAADIAAVQRRAEAVRQQHATLDLLLRVAPELDDRLRDFAMLLHNAQQSLDQAVEVEHRLVPGTVTAMLPSIRLLEIGLGLLVRNGIAPPELLPDAYCGEGRSVAPFAVEIGRMVKALRVRLPAVESAKVEGIAA